MKRNPIRSLDTAFGATLVMLAPPARSDDITVMASAVLKEAYLELPPEFEQASRYRAISVGAGGVDIAALLSRMGIADQVKGKVL